MSIPRSIIEKVRTANNFEYLGPLSRSEFFFDRERALEDATVVCGQIVKGTTGGVLVLGGRGSGKSSFLDAVRRRLISRKIASAKIPLDEGMVQVGNEKLFFKTILTELIRASKETGLLEEKLVNKIVSFLSGFGKLDEIGIDLYGIGLVAKIGKQDSADTRFPYMVLRDGLSDFLRLLDEKGQGEIVHGAILLLDEGDALTLNRNLLQILRNVFQETPKIGLIIAGSTNMLSHVSEVFSPLPRFFRRIELGPYPAESVVYDSIQGPLNFSVKELQEQGIKLDVIHHTFDRIVSQVTGRMPMEVNMFANFAFDLGARRMRLSDDTYRLYMKADREVLDQAIKQLGGTKEYNAFINTLDNNEVSCLVLLSKSLENETTDELAVLMGLHGMGGALQLASVNDIAEKIKNSVTEKGKIAALLMSIQKKAQAHKINVLSSTLIMKPRFAVEDQWVRAYFKYGWSDIDVNLELGLKPKFGGIRVFGDPVGTIIHSTFFPRLASKLGKKTGRQFLAHAGRDGGRWLKAGRDRKILNTFYARCATNSDYHIAFQVRRDAEIEGIQNAIKILMVSIQKAGLVDSYSVVVQ